MEKFIDHLIKFKLQKVDSYHQTSNNKTHPNKVNLVQLKQHLQKKDTIHEDYKCDDCQMEPIVGVRYHCSDKDCKDDFDLCE